MALRLPKEVWEYINQVGDEDFLWNEEEGEFFELMYPGWIEYIRDQVTTQYNIMVFQTSIFGEGLLASRETKENVPSENSWIWG